MMENWEVLEEMKMQQSISQYERKCENLRRFQQGKDLWKIRAY